MVFKRFFQPSRGSVRPVECERLLSFHYSKAAVQYLPKFFY